MRKYIDLFFDRFFAGLGWGLGVSTVIAVALIIFAVLK